jgi:hypothetical protein
MELFYLAVFYVIILWYGIYHVAITSMLSRMNTNRSQFLPRVLNLRQSEFPWRCWLLLLLLLYTLSCCAACTHSRSWRSF